MKYEQNLDWAYKSMSLPVRGAWIEMSVEKFVLKLN